MLTPLLNVNMKTIEVEGDQRKHQGAVDKPLWKHKSVLWMAITFHCAKNWTALVGHKAGQQSGRGFLCSDFYEVVYLSTFSRKPYILRSIPTIKY